jgi:hypothetical protein
LFCFYYFYFPFLLRHLISITKTWLC